MVRDSGAGMGLKELRRALVLAVVLLAAVVSPASAAVLTGGSDDPPDAPLVTGSSERAVDVKAVHATYDEDAGDLTVTVDVYPYAPDHITYFGLDARLGIPKPGVGCADDQDDITLTMEDAPDNLDWGPLEYAFLDFNASSGYIGHVEGAEGYGPERRYTATLSGVPALVGLGMRCVAGIETWMYARTQDSKAYYETRDEVRSFCLDDSCSPPPPPSDDKTPPIVSWSKPVAGGIVKGLLTERDKSCLVDATDASGIDHTENYVDGELHDTQVNAPWACDLDTRSLEDGTHTLMVKAFDKAGNTATSTITIDVRNADAPPVVVPKPKPPVLAPIDDRPVPVTPTREPEPPTVVRVPEPPTRSKLTVRTARARVSKALVKELGKAFKRRRSFVRTCSASSRRVVSCRVGWRYKKRAYRGKVRVHLLGSGRCEVRVSVRAHRTKPTGAR